ncbi:MAG TPA: hypothetical protein VNJ01_12890 [Bacteriovoracaceae bacterium]|nr:hypothetical protein [Bacteriovoracaceae bacterium]
MKSHHLNNLFILMILTVLMATTLNYYYYSIGEIRGLRATWNLVSVFFLTMISYEISFFTIPGSLTEKKVKKVSRHPKIYQRISHVEIFLFTPLLVAGLLEWTLPEDEQYFINLLPLAWVILVVMSLLSDVPVHGIARSNSLAEAPVAGEAVQKRPA